MMERTRKRLHEFWKIAHAFRNAMKIKGKLDVMFHAGFHKIEVNFRHFRSPFVQAGGF
ncbi:hypothetical protein ALQ57_03176 [Pseudomonas amygdali pv. hibisci]|uniref:Uncharacterized protein n=1 Tax=Pseudomonas amygdali pv. hibisci TaxID=251723 RepID=A0AB34U231_PSEA0|nr:Unknown protein sequence [Pseudomonas amygdali pv. hibisci]RMN57807.1 hypothetical protein ALQ57_03176 [Pseudomonas amygdali pv. hibisci]